MSAKYISDILEFPVTLLFTTHITKDITQYQILLRYYNIDITLRFARAPRANLRGGGLALLVRSNLKVKKNKCSSYRSMEVMDYNIRSGNELVHIVLIYRPLYSSKHKIPISCFLEEFGSLMVSLFTSPGHLIIAGDLNLHVDNQQCTEAN